MNKKIILSLCLLSLLFLATHQGFGQKVKPRNIKGLRHVEFDNTFKGLVVPGKKFNQIILVHGIGVQPADYAKNFIASCVDYLDLTNGRRDTVKLFDSLIYYPNDSVYKLRDLLNNPTNLPKKDIPGVYRETYQRNSDSSYYVFYIIHWSPITTPLKAWLNAADYQYRRPCVIDLGKRKLMNQGLSDVAEYFNPEIRRRILELIGYGITLAQMENSIFTKLNPNMKVKDNTLNFVTASFGSKTAFDALKKAQDQFEDNRDPIINFIKTDQFVNSFNTNSPITNFTQENFPKNILNPDAREYNFYMLSNQLPLLEISELDKPKDTCHTSALTAIQLFEEKLDSTTIKNFVLFHDPNDILGYYVPRELLKYSFRGKINTIANVTYRNARSLGKMSNPIKSHTNSFQNCEMHYYILFGQSKANIEEKKLEIEIPETEIPKTFCKCTNQNNIKK